MDVKGNCFFFVSLFMTIVTIFNFWQIKELNVKLNQVNILENSGNRARRAVDNFELSNFDRISRSKKFKELLASEVTNYMRKLPAPDVCILWKQCQKNASIESDRNVVIPGPRGPRGLKGETGPRGPRGEKGLPASKPVIKEYSLNVTANISDDKTIFCKVFGNPLPSLMWIHNVSRTDIREEIDRENAVVTSKLLLRNLSWEDRGKVTCYAKNILGASEATGYINIHTPPIVSCPNKLLHTYVGVDYTFPTCNITANPLATISWKRGFGIMDSSRIKNADNTILIQKVKYSDEGYYIMKTQNYLGISKAVIQLRTKSIALIEKPSSSLTFVYSVNLTCVAEGDTSKMSGTWKNILDQTDKQLNVTRTINGSRFALTMETFESGTYQCLITNGMTDLNAITTIKKISMHSSILTRNQHETLQSLLKNLPRTYEKINLCYRLDGRIDENLFQKCINKEDSIVLVKESSDLIGVFSSISGSSSFTLDCRNDMCIKKGDSKDPVCLKKEEDSCQADLIIQYDDGNTLKHKFKPIWPRTYYDIVKIEVFNFS